MGKLGGRVILYQNQNKKFPLFVSGKYQLKPEFQKLEKPATEMPKLYSPQTVELMEQLLQIFNPKRNPGDEISVALQIQQRAVPMALQDFRVIPVKVEDQVRYLATDISDETYIVQELHRGLGKCNCPSKFFCHHLLAVRFRAGVQTDLKIPLDAKLPKPSEKGLRPSHGTKRPNTAGTKNPKPGKKLKLHGEDSEEEEEEEVEDPELDQPDVEDVLFLTSPEDKRRAPLSVPDDIPAPDVASLPPAPKVPSLPSLDVSPSLVAAVQNSEFEVSDVIASIDGSIEAPGDEVSSFDKLIGGTFKRPKEPTATMTWTSKTPSKPKGGKGNPPLKVPSDPNTDTVIKRIPSIPTSPCSMPGTLGTPMASSTLAREGSVDEDVTMEDLSIMNDKNLPSPTEEGGSKNMSEEGKRFLKCLSADKMEALLLFGKEEIPPKSATLLPNADTGSEATEISDQLSEKDLRMGLNETKSFKFGSRKFTYETKESGLVIIHTEEDEDVPSVVQRAAATAGASLALAKPNDMGIGRNYIVRVAIHLNGKPEQELSSPEEYEISCLCGKAMKRAEVGPSTINCSSCNRMFHTEHVTRGKTKRRQFKCVACSQPICGLKWGAGDYKNTCPIDGFLTASALACLENPSMLQDLKAFKKTAELRLAEAIEQTKLNFSDKAQKVWGDYITTYGGALESFRDTDDLHGDAFARTLEPLGPSANFITKFVCANGKSCKSKKQSVRIFKECSLPADCSTVTHGLELKLDEMIQQCDSCLDERKYHVVGNKKVHLQNTKKPALFFSLNTQGSKFTAEDYMKGPQEISIDGIKYALKCIHLHTAREPAHYRTLIPTGEGASSSWLLYDGLPSHPDKANLPKFRPSVPSDFAKKESMEGYTPSSVVFFKM